MLVVIHILMPANGLCTLAKSVVPGLVKYTGQPGTVVQMGNIGGIPEYNSVQE